MEIVSRFGKQWARNPKNIAKVPDEDGVYILFDGSMPLYVGKGKLRQRITKHRMSKGRGQLWDRFSWFQLSDPKMTHDIEALLLKAFPRYLRSLNKQTGHFVGADPTDESDDHADPISRRRRKQRGKGSN